MKNYKFLVRYFVFSFVLTLSAFYCGINIFSDSDDIKLGKQMDAEIRKNPKEYPILEGYQDVKQYVTDIGNKILASPFVKKRNIYAYKFEIIKDDSTINAFCTPGGYIYVYTGLMKFVDNEATLAGVISHEIAHAELRHATKRITKVYGAQLLLSIALGEKPSQIAEITANLFTGLALLANSRADETEADEYSIKYLQSTEYYPGSIIYFFEKVQKGRSRAGAFERLLSTHPLPQDRVDHVRKIMNQIGNPQPTESNLLTERYSTFKQRLP